MGSVAYNPPEGKHYKWYISGIFPANRVIKLYIYIYITYLPPILPGFREETNQPLKSQINPWDLNLVALGTSIKALMLLSSALVEYAEPALLSAQRAIAGPSMGRWTVYLPTFKVDFYRKCR